jgi:phosphoenolpyruvate carboxylase
MALVADPHFGSVPIIEPAAEISARTFEQAETSRHAVGEAPPYAEAAEFVADLGILYHSLTANGSAALARGRLRSLRRAANTFGFHLAGIDLRQNSEVHERTVGELFEMACTASNYAGLPEAARISLLREELKTATAFFAFPTLFRGDGLGADDPARVDPRTSRGSSMKTVQDQIQ